MTNKKTDLNPFDPMGFLQKVNPMKLLEEFDKALNRYSVPGFDAVPFLDSQRKNLEALMAVNLSLADSSQQLLQRQMEMLAQANQQAAAAASAMAGGKPGELQQKQAEMVSAAYDKSIAVLRDAVRLVENAQQEASKILDKRWSESIKALQSLAKK